MSGCSWWDRSTGFALLTIVLWASLAALTSRVTSVSPLVLVGLVLFFCGVGALPFWRQWRARPLWREAGQGGTGSGRPPG